MEYNKHFYTCDRCRKKFDLLPKDVSSRLIFWRKNRPLIACMNTAELSGYVSKTELLGEVVLSTEITEYYNCRNRAIHLCADCRKAFEKFMENN